MDSGDYFSVHCKFLKIVGISVEPNEGVLSKFRSLFVFGIKLAWMIISSVEIYLHFDDILNRIISVFFVVGLLVELLKGFAIYVHRVQLGKALKELQNEMFVPNEERGIEARKLVDDCVVLGRRQAIVGNILGLTAISFLASACYYKRLTTQDAVEWELPLGKLSIINVKSSPNFELVLLLQTITLYGSAIGFISCDSLIANVLGHIATQMTILRNYIRLFKLKSYQRMLKAGYALEAKTTITWTHLEKTLKEIVDYHSAILEVSNRFEEVFNGALLVEFVGVICVLCTALYDCSLCPMTDPRFYQDLLIMSAVIPQVCILGYYGTQMSSEGESIADVWYEVDLLDTDARFQKGAALVILRSQKPIMFTMGKFVNLAVTTTVVILKFSVSYFMVLQKTQQKNTQSV